MTERRRDEMGMTNSDGSGDRINKMSRKEGRQRMAKTGKNTRAVRHGKGRALAFAASLVI